MSKSTKRKFVTAEVRDSFDVLPDREKGERIARLVAPRGNNLHEVEAPFLHAAEEQAGGGGGGQADSDPGQGATSSDRKRLEMLLVSMPNKFRKNVWVKRGDFVIIEPIDEGSKVRGEIANVLYKEQIKYIKSEGLWPEEFEEEKQKGVEKKLGEFNVAEKEDDSGEEEEEEEEVVEDSSDNDDDLFKNTNRPVVQITDEEDTDSEEEEEEEEKL